MSQDKKVYLELVGTDGNALAVIGNFRRAARQQGFEKEWIQEICAEALTGDYDKVLQTILEHTTPISPEEVAAEAAAKKLEELSVGDIDEEKGGSYWEEEGAYQELQDKYWKKLVSGSGEAETPHGELLRMINRFYYDVYNNGLCNDKKEEVKFILDNIDKIKPFIEEKPLELITAKLREYDENGGDDCPVCDGRGYVEVENILCDTCGGSGTEEVDCEECGGEGDGCNACGGDGFITQTCSECGGSGEVDGIEDCYRCETKDDSAPFCWSISLDLLIDAILQYVDKTERELEE